MADSTSTPAREPTERPSIDWGRPLSSLRGIATSAVTQEENASSTYRIQRASRRQTLEGDEGVTGQALSTRRKHSTSLQMRRTLRFSPIAHARHEACEPLCASAPSDAPLDHRLHRNSAGTRSTASCDPASRLLLLVRRSLPPPWFFWLRSALPRPPPASRPAVVVHLLQMPPPPAIAIPAKVVLATSV